MESTSLTPLNTAITERARSKFDGGQIELIRHTVASECNDGELAIFLEECARYELDPFAKQIWAIKIQGKMQIVVSRDGLLAIANRHTDFRGVQSFEIREHDLFIPTVDDDGHVHVRHEWRDEKGEPTHGGSDGELRGKIIGAFAYCRRAGHVDTQFMAYTAQYNKHQNVWKSHPTAMHIKVPEAMVLRKAYSISGVVGEFEIEPEPLAITRPGERPLAIDFGDDPELANDLKTAFEALRYRHAKIRTMMRGVDTEAKRRALSDILEARIMDAATGDVIDGEVVAEA